MHFEWSLADVRNAINKAKDKGRSSITLAMQSNTYTNELQVVKWAEEMGYEVKHEMERVIIKLT